MSSSSVFFLGWESCQSTAQDALCNIVTEGVSVRSRPVPGAPMSSRTKRVQESLGRYNGAATNRVRAHCNPREGVPPVRSYQARRQGRRPPV